MDDLEWTPLARVSRGAVSADRRTLGLELLDADGEAHRFSLDVDAYAAFVVSLMAVAETARRAREAEGVPESEAAETTALLPFPVVSYHLGRSEEGDRAVLRLSTDGGLHWDFLLPMTALARLRADLKALLPANDG